MAQETSLTSLGPVFVFLIALLHPYYVSVPYSRSLSVNIIRKTLVSLKSRKRIKKNLPLAQATVVVWARYGRLGLASRARAPAAPAAVAGSGSWFVFRGFWCCCCCWWRVMVLSVSKKV